MREQTLSCKKLVTEEATAYEGLGKVHNFLSEHVKVKENNKKSLAIMEVSDRAGRRNNMSCKPRT